jgi:hypothetical protein
MHTWHFDQLFDPADVISRFWWQLIELSAR